MIFNAYSEAIENIFGITIKSCGHIFAQNGRRIHRPNGRDDWLLFYVSKGCEHFILDSQTDASEGSFIFFKPHEKQEHIYLGTTTAEFYFIHFTAPSDFNLFGFDSSVVYSAKPSTDVRDLFEEILNELHLKQPAYEKICISKFMNIIALLERNIAAQTKQQNRYFSAISFVIQSMNREYNVNYTLDEYAKMCRMSKFHFLRIFKEITGTTPLDYRNKIRIEHAKTMIEDDNIPIREIAMRTGYNSLSYFSDAFKKVLKISPTQYRQTAKLKHQRP